MNRGNTVCPFHQSLNGGDIKTLILTLPGPPLMVKSFFFFFFSSYKAVTHLFYPSNDIHSTLVISNFTGPDKNVRVISSSRQPNCDVIGMTTVRLSVRQNVLGRHMYMAI